jgi:hypothetical protein
MQDDFLNNIYTFLNNPQLLISFLQQATQSAGTNKKQAVRSSGTGKTKSSRIF